MANYLTSEELLDYLKNSIYLLTMFTENEIVKIFENVCKSDEQSNEEILFSLLDFINSNNENISFEDKREMSLLLLRNINF